MKKLFALVTVFLLAACGAEDKVVDVLGVNCAFVGNGEISKLVKCPIVPELVAIQAEEPDTMSLDGDYAGVNIATYVTDKDFVWVNIVENDCGENTVGYRVMIPEPVFDGVQMQAVRKCK